MCHYTGCSQAGYEGHSCELYQGQLGGESVNNEVESVIKVSKGTADLLDLLAETNGTSRIEIVTIMIEQDVMAALDSPVSFWNREHSAERDNLK
jgi:hypothetical protein